MSENEDSEKVCDLCEKKIINEEDAYHCGEEIRGPTCYVRCFLLCSECGDREHEDGRNPAYYWSFRAFQSRGFLEWKKKKKIENERN